MQTIFIVINTQILLKETDSNPTKLLYFLHHCK